MNKWYVCYSNSFFMDQDCPAHIPARECIECNTRSEAEELADRIRLYNVHVKYKAYKFLRVQPVPTKLFARHFKRAEFHAFD